MIALVAAVLSLSARDTSSKLMVGCSPSEDM